MNALPALGDIPGAPEPRPGTLPAALPRRQKAAIVVRLLLAEGAELKLGSLPEEMQVELTRQMTQMRLVDRETLRQVVAEFEDELQSVGLSFPGGLEAALSVLDGTIAPETIARLRKQAGFSMAGDPWDRVADVDTDRLLPLLERESVEVAAVLLSKLKVSKAAELLGRLPGERARRITYAVSLTGGISPATVRKIGLSLATQLDAQPARAFAEGPVERVGAILNSSPAATRDAILSGLDETDAAFAELVRRSIFTYSNIPARLDPRDVPKVIRDVDQDTLIKAMAGATGADAATTDFILSNISKRMADNLREEIETAGAVKPKDAEEAMSAVVAAIRALEAEGTIFLIASDD